MILENFCFIVKYDIKDYFNRKQHRFQEKNSSVYVSVSSLLQHDDYHNMQVINTDV